MTGSGQARTAARFNGHTTHCRGRQVQRQRCDNKILNSRQETTATVEEARRPDAKAWEVKRMTYQVARSGSNRGAAQLARRGTGGVRAGRLLPACVPPPRGLALNDSTTDDESQKGREAWKVR